MRVLLTGASGFVGSHIADALVAAGADLRCLLRPTSSLEFLTITSFERSNGDVRQPESLAEAVRDVDVVVHCAGTTSAKHESQYLAVNSEGTRVLIDAARAAGVKRFVYISSLAAQGASPDGHPQDPQTVIPHPTSPYGRSKLGGEIAILNARNDLEAIVIRPPVVYGPRDRGLIPFHRFVAAHLMPLYGNGSQRLSWVYATDLAAAVSEAALEGADSGSIFTVAEERSYSWKELGDLLGEALNRRFLAIPIPPALFAVAAAACAVASLPLRQPLPLTRPRVREMALRYWICSNDRVKEELRWRPKVAAQDGLAATVQWYREKGWL